MLCAFMPNAPNQIKCKNAYEIIRNAWLVDRSDDGSVCAQPFNHRLCGGLANEIENTTKNHERIGGTVHCHCGGNINSINYLNHIIRVLKFNPWGKWSKVRYRTLPSTIGTFVWHLPALNNDSDDTMAYESKIHLHTRRKKVHETV